MDRDVGGDLGLDRDVGDDLALDIGVDNGSVLLGDEFVLTLVSFYS